MKKFVACGATVAVNHLPGDDGALAAIEEMRAAGNVLSAPGDVSDATSAPAMVRAAIDELGGLDILINNAGTAVSPVPTDFKDLDAMTDEFWSATLDTNLLGAFRCTREAAPELKAARGAVVSTASVAGLGLRGSSIAYGASKAALINLTSSLARALAPEVRVNAIAPGLVNSDWECRFDEEYRASSLSRMPLRRAGDPADYAEVILFLCAGAAYVTGQTITVDGGSAIHV